MQDSFTSDPFSRFLKISGMATKVGLSFLGNKTLSLILGEDSAAAKEAEFWIANGERILQTLGSLKGGAMKVGQMLSLQESFLPPEFIQVIRLLQKEAPPVSFSIMETVLKEELPDYHSIFQSIDPKPFASASIGQVHRGILHDGRDVAVKIQFPEMESILKSDLKNLKVLFQLLLSRILKVDFTAIWNELNRGLIEELDYQKELQNQKEFRELFSDHPFIIIPAPVAEASTKRVLTTEFLIGKEMQEVQKTEMQENKNLWGQNLFKSFLTQVFLFRKIHADPNSGNYSFLPGGKIILYDFGSVKPLSENLVQFYKNFIEYVKDNRIEEIPLLLKNIGIYHAGGKLVEKESVINFVNLFRPIFSGKPYQFTEKDLLFQKIGDFKQKNAAATFDMLFPAEMVFVNRSLVGLYGNLVRLKTEANWKDIAVQIIFKGDADERNHH